MARSPSSPSGTARPSRIGVMYPTEPVPMLLAGGVTLPVARGRGAYRALVHARWKAARRAGAPALVTQAQAGSRPILEHLGFRATGTIDVLVDSQRNDAGSLHGRH